MPRGRPVHRQIERRAWAVDPFNVTLAAAVRAKRLEVTRKDPRMQVTYGTPRELSASDQVQFADARSLRDQARSDFGAVITGLEPDEPIFVVRARDALALGFVTQYAAQAAIGGLFDAERSESLAADVQRIVEWRRAHVERVRDPD